MKTVLSLSMAALMAMNLTAGASKLPADSNCGTDTTTPPNWNLPSLPSLPDNIPDDNTPDFAFPELPDSDETPTPDDNNASLSGYAAQVVQLVNAERAQYGLSALTMDAKASAAALVRAGELKDAFSHTRPDGRSCFTALTDAGVSYRGAGENIAYGQATPAAVVQAWMNSEGHRANILSNKYTAIGVGYTVIGGTSYWAQLFTY